MMMDVRRGGMMIIGNKVKHCMSRVEGEMLDILTSEIRSRLHEHTQQGNIEKEMVAFSMSKSTFNRASHARARLQARSSLYRCLLYYTIIDAMSMMRSNAFR